eukprot:9362688-Karenia_brevis.AAC.1
MMCRPCWLPSKKKNEEAVVRELGKRVETLAEKMAQQLHKEIKNVGKKVDGAHERLGEYEE